MVTKYQNIALHQLILFVILLLLSKNIYMMPRLDILYIKQSVILYVSPPFNIDVAKCTKLVANNVMEY